jgi:hypothetical protein
MAVEDRNVHKDAKFPLKEFDVYFTTAVSQTDKEVFNWLPGFQFEVVDVQIYCETEAGAVTADVKVGGTSALASEPAFASATRVAGALHATLGNRRGTATQALTVEYTSDGTGALTNGRVIVTIAKIPRQGEVLYQA